MIPPTLLVFFAEGCPACAVAKPEVERFKHRNPMQMTLTLDADGPFAERYGLAPIRATPLYVLRVGEQGVKHDGVMKAEQLEKWVRGALAAIEEDA